MQHVSDQRLSIIQFMLAFVRHNSRRSLWIYLVVHVVSRQIEMKCKITNTARYEDQIIWRKVLGYYDLPLYIHKETYR